MGCFLWGIKIFSILLGEEGKKTKSGWKDTQPAKWESSSPPLQHFQGKVFRILEVSWAESPEVMVRSPNIFISSFVKTSLSCPYFLRLLFFTQKLFSVKRAVEKWEIFFSLSHRQWKRAWEKWARKRSGLCYSPSQDPANKWSQAGRGKNVLSSMWEKLSKQIRRQKFLSEVRRLDWLYFRLGLKGWWNAPVEIFFTHTIREWSKTISPFSPSSPGQSHPENCLLRIPSGAREAISSKCFNHKAPKLLAIIFVLHLPPPTSNWY